MRVLRILLSCGLLFAAGPIAAAGPLVWELRAGEQIHYLAGSIHMLPETDGVLPPAFEFAYAATQALVLESDLDTLASNTLQARLLGAARDDRPGGLQARIGTALYEQLQTRAEALGMPTPVCNAFRAWFCAMTLELTAMQQAGFSAELGVDYQLNLRAREDQRPVIGLEAPERQVELLIEMNDEVAKRFLAATLDEGTEGGQAPQDLMQVWREGDLQGLNAMVSVLRKNYPLVHERLLAARNKKWIAALAPLREVEMPHLIVVGAAHLPGADGLLVLLEKAGWKLRRLEAAETLSAPQAVNTAYTAARFSPE